MKAIREHQEIATKTVLLRTEGGILSRWRSQFSRSRWSLRSPFLTSSQALMRLLVYGIACRKEFTRVLLVEVGPPFCLRQEIMFHSVSGFLCFFHVYFSWYLWAPVGEEAECDLFAIVIKARVYCPVLSCLLKRRLFHLGFPRCFPLVVCLTLEGPYAQPAWGYINRTSCRRELVMLTHAMKLVQYNPSNVCML